jgi:hypothetical protein
MTGDAAMRDQVERHAHWLEDRAQQRGIAKTPLAARTGDVLVWHDLAHGGDPRSHATTRKSIMTPYCPTHLSPQFSENVATRLWNHGGHRYTTSHYGGDRSAERVLIFA